MSGGRLVVLDRPGRGERSYDLPSGMVTLGSDPRTDIKIMMPNVSSQHAKVVVHANQTIVRNVGSFSTLVNGKAVSVAALQHGDVITVGGRSLRWEYLQPDKKRPLQAEPALAARGPPGARRLRGSGPAPAPRSPALQLALELRHRASMPANSSVRQVAIVTPQRRDTHQVNSPGEVPPRKSVRTTPGKTTPGKATPGKTPPGKAPAHTTQATLWLEARKSSPRVNAKTPPAAPPAPPGPPGPRAASARKRTPLRLAVLRRAQSAHKPAVAKIQEPSAIDYTKQAAIRLMTRHTPKSAVPGPQPARAGLSPAYVLRKPGAARGGKPPSPAATPKRDSMFGGRRGKRTTWGQSVSVLEISDSTQDQNSTIKSLRSTRGSPLLPSPRKSALKDPKADKSHRKAESIKFDLSNLENFHDDDDVVSMQDSSVDDLSLRYSDTTDISPSPRRSIHSRSSKILQKTLGTTIETVASEPSTLTPQSPSRKSLRGSIILQKALSLPDKEKSRYSSRTTKSASDSFSSARKTLDVSPRSPANSTVESYSVVDLVSIDSNESCRSTLYKSAGSVNSSTINFGTPNERKTRSTIGPYPLLSSTPYVGRTRKSGSRDSSLQSSIKVISPRDSSIKVISPRNSSIKTRNSSPKIINSSPRNSPQNSTLQNSVSKSLRNSTIRNSSQNATRDIPSRSSSRRSHSSPNISRNSQNSTKNSSRRSKSVSTPENTSKHISVNGSRISRRSRSRSRLNDSELLLLDATDVDDSPKSSRRGSRAAPAPSRVSRRHLPVHASGGSPQHNDGTVTPENTHVPEEAGTPMFSIQSLLDSSKGSVSSPRSEKKGRISINPSRKTIGVVHDPRISRRSLRSKSFHNATESGLNRYKSHAEILTPKSAVKIIQEAVKNKHSTAKKPQSKRSIIDNLNDSYIVKQLFNSPVKRKLSQSMTEFSKKHLFDDEDLPAKRPARNTIALTGRSPDSSLLEHTDRYTTDVFVSPIATPEKNQSPIVSGVKLLFRRNKTSTNDLSDVQGVKELLRSPRTRKSVKNDLTDVVGIKNVFVKSPRNRLSDVRGVKEIFAAKENNDLRHVTGVKSLFQQKGRSPHNDLSDVRGVRSLFQKKSPRNDLRNVSGVKKGLRVNSPKNDLSDVRGVKLMFQQKRQTNNDLNVSGVEELFNDSNGSYKETSNAESLFDQLVGRAVPKAVYSKSLLRASDKKKSGRKAKSLAPLDINTNNVEEWLEQELRKRVQNDKSINKSKSVNKFNKSINKELSKLATDTVEGGEPLRTSRVRNSTTSWTSLSERHASAAEAYGARTLPLKKRSLLQPHAADRAPSLPLKKRALLHSTPLKGSAAARAASPGRVSPIAAVGSAQQVDELPQFAEPKTSARGRKATKNQVQVSPKPKETVKSPVKSPPKRATRGKASSIVAITNTKKGRNSLVIAKKSPIMSPAPAPRKGRKVVETKDKTNDEKPVTRTRRTQKAEKSVENDKVESPKPAPKPARRGRKVTENENAVSPKTISKSTRRGKKVEDSPKPSPKKTRGNRVAEVKPTTPKTSRAKVQKGAVVVSKPSPVIKPQVTTRGKKTQEKPEVVKRSRKTEQVASPETSPPKRRRAADNASKTQENKVEIAEPKAKRGRKTAPVEDTGKRTRKTPETVAKEPKSKNSPQKGEPRTRGKKVENQASTESEPVRKGRRNQRVNNTAPVETGRKRKLVKEDAKLVKSKSEEEPKRGKRATKVETSVKEDKEEGRGKRKTASNTKQVATTKPAQKVDEPKPVRGRQAAAAPPEAGGRKRKTEIEDTKKQPAAKKARRSVASSPAKGRSTRAKKNASGASWIH